MGKRRFRHSGALSFLVALQLSAPMAGAQEAEPGETSGEVPSEASTAPAQGAEHQGVEDPSATSDQDAEDESLSAEESDEPPPTSEADSEATKESLDDDDLTAERSVGATDGEQAISDAPTEAPLEDQEDWLKWPFSKKNQEYPRQEEPHRWASLGGFVGWVHRTSRSDAIEYRPGIAWGGYLRPELVSWMGLRLFYREERLPARVKPGAFDYGTDTYDDDFEQPDLQTLNLGARLEPSLVVQPRLRVRGIFGWSWLWFRAPFPKSDDFELKRTFRSAVQMDFSVGAGASFDIIKNWVDISVDATYSIPAAQTGEAYKKGQIVRDGVIQHIAPLPKLNNSTDFLISLGVIL